MTSKHKDVGQMFKDNVLRVCFWTSTAIGALGLVGSAQNLINGDPEAAKGGGKVALWAGLTDLAVMAGAALTGKKLVGSNNKDVTFDEIQEQVNTTNTNKNNGNTLS